jgi:hypothetical protein
MHSTNSPSRSTPPSRLLTFSIVIAAIVGCGPRAIVDNWGTSGHARFSGTVSRANGALFGNATMFWMCGADSANGFGGMFSSRTDGTFEVDVSAPGPYPLPVDRRFVCRVSIAPANESGPAGAVTTRALFEPSAELRPTTSFGVREGTVVDSTVHGR